MFGALEGEKHYFFELGLPKMRNCLHFDALESEKPRVFEHGSPKVRNCPKKLKKSISKIANPRNCLKKLKKLNSGDSWAQGPGFLEGPKIETVTRICKFGQKSAVFLASRAPKIETLTRIAKVNFQILVRVSIFGALDFKKTSKN